MLNYGFIVENNDANEVPIKIYFNHDDPHVQMKKQMISNTAEFKKFRTSEDFNEKVMTECFSWLRFVEFDENIALLYQYQGAANAKHNHEDSDDDCNGFTGKSLPAISIQNEKRVWAKLKMLALESLGNYPTTYEEDLEILEKNEGLTFNTRNCVLFRSGEKKILLFLINTSDVMTEMLDLPLKDARKHLGHQKNKEQIKDYCNHVT